MFSQASPDETQAPSISGKPTKDKRNALSEHGGKNISIIYTVHKQWGLRLH